MKRIPAVDRNINPIMNKRTLILTLTAVLLQSCGSFSPVPPPIQLEAAPVILTETPIPSSTPTFAPLPTETLIPTVTSTPLPTADRVLIVSFDGLRPDAIAEADMVNVMSLMQSGAYTMSAQTIMPSLTLPAHASMLVGTCPLSTGPCFAKSWCVGRSWSGALNEGPPTRRRRAA